MGIKEEDGVLKPAMNKFWRAGDSEGWNEGKGYTFKDTDTLDRVIEALKRVSLALKK